MPKSTKPTTATGKAAKGFTDEERSAMQSRVKEVKAAGRRGHEADEQGEVLAKIAEMEGADRAMAKRLHALITASVPALAPKLWYGMPAYARDGKIVCFFQPARKFKTRYATLGFSDEAKLDDGALWPVAYALGKLTAADEARLRTLVKKAAS